MNVNFFYVRVINIQQCVNYISNIYINVCGYCCVSCLMCQCERCHHGSVCSVFFFQLQHSVCVHFLFFVCMWDSSTNVSHVAMKNYHLSIVGEKGGLKSNNSNSLIKLTKNSILTNKNSLLYIMYNILYVCEYMRARFTTHAQE